MLTGDDRRTAEAIARMAGIDDRPGRRSTGWQGRRDPATARRGPGGHGRRRDQRRAGAGPGRRRHRDGHGHRRGDRGRRT